MGNVEIQEPVDILSAPLCVFLGLFFAPFSPCLESVFFLNFLRFIEMFSAFFAVFSGLYSETSPIPGERVFVDVFLKLLDP